MAALIIEPVVWDVASERRARRKASPASAPVFSGKPGPEGLEKPQGAGFEEPGKFSVYLIEDDAHFRETFMDVMSLRKIEAASASSAAQALRDLQTLKPSVIVMDVRLPDIHGFDLCRQIKRLEAFKNTPILLISAAFRYDDPREQVEGLLAGASAFLSKPLAMEDLLCEIQSLFKKSGRPRGNPPQTGANGDPSDPPR